MWFLMAVAWSLSLRALRYLQQLSKPGKRSEKLWRPPQHFGRQEGSPPRRVGTLPLVVFLADFRAVFMTFS